MAFRISENPKYDYHLQYVRMRRIAEVIANFVSNKDKQYGSSWRRRGGVGAFMVIARKWDRIEEACSAEVFDGQETAKYDLFSRFTLDNRKEGISDDVVDLIGYLLVLLEHMIEEGNVDKICDTKIDGDEYLSPMEGN